MKIHEIRDSNLTPCEKYEAATQQALKAMEWMDKQPIEKQIAFRKELDETLEIVRGLEYMCKLGYDPIEKDNNI